MYVKYSDDGNDAGKKKSCIRKSREIVTCHYMEIACGDLTNVSYGY